MCVTLKGLSGSHKTWCFLSQEAWLLSRERELKEEVRRGRDKEIELAIQRLEEETRGAREECERAADNRCVSPSCFFVFLNCVSVESWVAQDVTVLPTVNSLWWKDGMCYKFPC